MLVPYSTSPTRAPLAAPHRFGRTASLALLCAAGLLACDTSPDAAPTDTQAAAAQPRAPDPHRVTDPRFAEDADAAPGRPHDPNASDGDAARPFQQAVVFPDQRPQAWPRPDQDSWAGRDGYGMVWVDGGRFQMASPTPEWLHEGDRQQEAWEPDPDIPERFYDATLTRGYWVGRTEVTQHLYEAVMGDNPAATKTMHWQSADLDPDAEVRPCAAIDGQSLVGDQLPVMCITWLEAAQFANALSLRDGLQPAYDIADGKVTWTWDSNGYRLPTEAEWEHAARGGQQVKYAGTTSTDDLCRYANLADASTRKRWADWEAFACDDGHPGLAPVASFEPNGYGLYDMTGNVFEWTWDVYRLDYDPDATVDPVNSSGNVDQIRHGGGWTTGRPLFARVSRRCASHATNRDFGLGMRLVRFE